MVIFSHGKEGIPDGNKIVRLMAVASNYGCQNISIDYRKIKSPDKRTEKLLETLKDNPTPLVLVGSSMGSYISIVASESVKPKGLFLLAPAIYLQGYEIKNPTPKAKLTTVIHGWNDEVVPVANAIQFAQKHQCRLHLLDSDHRLLSAMPLIERLFAIFLDELLN
ncbi:MAG: alpha/beta hydrolase [Magnetococcales bacterium]|nr:alpha/beta hydrolase [Magnetococcales bacterium]